MSTTPRKYPKELADRAYQLICTQKTNINEAREILGKEFPDYAPELKNSVIWGLSSRTQLTLHKNRPE